MATQHLSPADYVIKVFGGCIRVAEAVGLHRSAPSVWRHRGEIPTSKMAALLDVARRRGLDLTAEDLIQGRDVEVVEEASTPDTGATA